MALILWNIQVASEIQAEFIVLGIYYYDKGYLKNLLLI
jgi:hypothetical protein